MKVTATLNDESKQHVKLDSCQGQMSYLQTPKIYVATRTHSQAKQVRWAAGNESLQNECRFVLVGLSSVDFQNIVLRSFAGSYGEPTCQQPSNGQ